MSGSCYSCQPVCAEYWGFLSVFGALSGDSNVFENTEFFLEASSRIFVFAHTDCAFAMDSRECGNQV